MDATDVHAPGLADPLFLRLDQSKVPRNIYDDESFEAHTPAEWLAMKNKDGIVSGRSPAYLNGRWKWTRCEVLSYDEASTMYKIKLRYDGSVKMVHRLNLMFDKENTGLFRKRVRECHKRRQAGKAAIRLQHFLHVLIKKRVTLSLYQTRLSTKCLVWLPPGK